MYKITLTAISTLLFSACAAQVNRIPASYSNIGQDQVGLYLSKDGKKYYADSAKAQ